MVSGRGAAVSVSSSAWRLAVRRCPTRVEAVRRPSRAPARRTDRRPSLTWSTSLPSGRYRRTLDVDRAVRRARCARPEPEIALDEAALLIAAHAHPDLDVDARLAQLDALAASRRRARRRDELATWLFVDRGLRRQHIDYADPAQLVPRRRARPPARHPDHAERADDRGRARAAACELHGVGHARPLPRRRRRRRVVRPVPRRRSRSTSPAARRCSRSTHDRRARSGRSSSMPVGPRAILERMLGNLQHTLLQRDPHAVVWVTRLRLRIPGITLSQRGDLAGAARAARAVRRGRAASSTCSARDAARRGRRAGRARPRRASERAPN